MANLAKVSNIPDEVIKEHLKHNKKAWRDYQKSHTDQKYIEDQEGMGDIRYGIQNDWLSKLLLDGDKLDGTVNTCEVIAVYNALLSLNDLVSPESFPDLLAEFEEKGIMMDGYMGTAPDVMEVYFKENNYETKMISGENINSKSINKLQQEYDTYIITTYNEKDNIMKQVHTMSITRLEEKYEIHNDYKEGVQKYNSLEEEVYGYRTGNGEPICLIGIR